MSAKVNREARTWKALAYDAMREALEGAKVGEACEFMMDARVKILVFEDNELAEKFERQLKEMFPL